MGVTVLYLKMCLVIAGLLLVFSSSICGAVNTTSSSNKNKNKAAANRDAGGRIVGGDPATIEEFPWQIGLHDKPGGYQEQFCGGSILSDRWVLTAAHCVEGQNKKSLLVIAKVTRLDETSGSEHEVAEIIMHRRYNSDTINNDIALLKLSTPIELDDKAAAVNLPDTKLPGGRALYVTGWGALKSGGFPYTLQKVVVHSVTNRKCKKKYGSGSITGKMMCAADQGKDSCQGDSGGPLVDTNNNNTLVGIVSWGNGCADPKYPGVYTNVAKFTKWINNKTKNLT